LKWTRSRESQSSEGFSLLEVIAALFILSVGVLAVAQLLSGTLRTVQRADRHSRASAYARALMEEAYATEDLEEREDSFDLTDGFQATRDVRLLSSEELEISGRVVSLYEIEVKVTWPTNGVVKLTGKKLVYEKPE
jgi:prepilin-type N-terminal cleavage/methylation domain-containing protein